ncbi:type IV secretory system conjugative DNA transfer family protein [Shimazuella sp. AN120528]|uniref:VirD4-like conjugal transfer protein, CD1115 family n=1 Tax=Shimazuella soli TaxID=1892854 RepID=UPI001F0F66CC|nr:type IV secretory system conjugative DNA transfer family protein [Shimazuella soli]MCH5585069.1 type IV secretory system conjugative DNA transfer family protein [Shimazuella soli]
MEVVLAILLVAVPAGLSQFKWGQLPDVIRQATGIGLFMQMQLVIIVLAGMVARRVFLFLAGRTFKHAAYYGAHGTSRFAKKSELMNDRYFAKHTWKKSAQENLQNPSGIMLGLLGNKPLILPEETIIPNRNVFLVGSPGSGKTQSYLLTNLIHEQERSVVVTDPKGEIFEATAKLKEEQGYEVHLVNFLEMNISDRYNPLDYITKEIEAEQVATTIVANSGDKNAENDFWTRSEIALLKTLLLYVRYECPDEANLAKVKEILTVQGRTPKKMDQFFSNLPPDHPAYQSYLIVRMAEDKTRASIFISLGITLSKFDASDVRKFTEKSDFSLDDIGKKKMVIYCILPIADATWEPLTSTFFTQLFQRLYYVADHNYNKLPVKVSLLLDEFVNIGRIPRFEQILATCRSYGISISTIVQSMGQLVDQYTKEKAEGIIGNCSLRYLLGVDDKMTAEYFSELIGKTTIQTRSTSKTKGKEQNSSLSKQYGERMLINADELSRMHRDEGMLLISGMYPAKLRKMYQWEFFKGILHDQNRSSRFDYQTPMAFEVGATPEAVQKEEPREETVNKQQEQNMDTYLLQGVEQLESRLRANLSIELAQELDEQLAKLSPTAPNYSEQKFDLLRAFFTDMQQKRVK